MRKFFVRLVNKKLFYAIPINGTLRRGHANFLCIVPILVKFFPFTFCDFLSCFFLAMVVGEGAGRRRV